MEQKRKDFLNSIYQNCGVAMQSINDLLDKVQSKNLKEELKSQYKLYDNIKKKCEKVAIDKDLDAKENNWFEKAKMWTSLKMTTLIDNSTRHIAEMLLLGTVMGLNVCYKDKWDYLNVDDELEKIREELEKLEEDCYSSYKKYLKGNLDEEDKKFVGQNCECNCSSNNKCDCGDDCDCDNDCCGNGCGSKDKCDCDKNDK